MLVFIFHNSSTEKCLKPFLFDGVGVNRDIIVFLSSAYFRTTYEWRLHLDRQDMFT